MTLPLKVVNMFAGPGTGKSTTATGLFHIMKSNGFKVELVTELAKDFTYERNHVALGNQLYILGCQDYRQRRLVGHCDWVVTDSPLPLGLAYTDEEYVEWLPDATWSAFDRYDNFNVLLHRSSEHPYQTYGRNQTEEQAMVLDNIIDSLYSEAETANPRQSIEVSSGQAAPWRVFEWIKHMESIRNGTP